MSGEGPGGAGRKALVVLHEEPLGGASMAVLRILPELEDRGWRIAFWAPNPSPLHRHLRALGHEVHGADRPLAHSWRGLRQPPGPARRVLRAPGYLARFAATVRRLRPDVVHANSLLSTWEAVTARAAGARVVLYVHEMLGSTPKATAAGCAARAGAHVVVAVSEACARSLARVGIDARVVPGGVPAPAEPASREGASQAIGTIGTISRRKGSDLFVEAARRVRARDNEVGAEMIGSTEAPLEQEWIAGVLELAARAGVRHRASADVQAALASWDVFVLPSREDPFPSVVLEAMAAGVPVVAAGVDGVPEQVGDEAGLLVPAEDPGALADAVLDLLGSPSRRRAMGAAGRWRVGERFTLSKQAEGIHAAYLEACR
ncbi:MAG TPA: glycosyltransferase family 4 protein [Solirubrobacterales bacterium]|nr:glycosyltransferase family 4 protein [Solirubrobacterales bacterium]